MNQIPLTSRPGAVSTLPVLNTSQAAVGNMDMGMSCKISMLWNWNTIDACFISKSWRITSHGMFAGSCIGVILLVMSLEFLRRLSKEYDRYILRRFKESIILTTCTTTCPNPSGPGTQTPQKVTATTSDSVASNSSNHSTATATTAYFRPSIIQQSIRALLHMITFAVAYFIMLLAMYYNGYFIICIFIGAYLGAFVFSWEGVSVSMGMGSDGTRSTAAMDDVTVCCG